MAFVIDMLKLFFQVFVDLMDRESGKDSFEQFLLFRGQFA